MGLTGALVAATVAGAVVTSVMAPDAPKPVAPPTPTAPSLMPDPDQQATDAANKKAQARLAATSGRASTILTGSDNSGDTLGG